MRIWTLPGSFVVLLLGVALLGGCAAEKKTSENQTDNKPNAADDHSGWWCVEHAIPEEVCSMCSAKAAAEFKEKGDWCDEHNRAKSQCFICDPSQAEKHAKLYKAKYGKEPPKAIE